MKNVILFGSTGMIGQELKNELLKQNIFLYLPVRNTFQQETKTQQIQYLDFQMRFISFFGTKMKKYKPVTPKQVAFYMAQNLGNHKHRINIHESDSINNNKGNT